MADQKTISVYDEQTEKYLSIVKGDEPDEALKLFLEHMQPGASVLDLGCGPAQHSSIMIKWGFNVVAVDASEEMVKLANKTYGIDARVATFADIPSLGKFDGIWANFSLLHATRDDFKRHLFELHDILNEDGLLHIGTKLGEGEYRDKIGRFYTYCTESELSGLLEGAGFASIGQTTGEEPGLSGEISPWITVLSRKINH